jgi:hypothetical protein
MAPTLLELSLQSANSQYGEGGSQTARYCMNLFDLMGQALSLMLHAEWIMQNKITTPAKVINISLRLQRYCP